VLARGDTVPPGDTPDPDGPEPPAIPAIAAEDTDTAEPDRTADQDDSAPLRSRQLSRMVAIIGALIIVLGAFGIWATVAGNGLRTTAAGANAALVNASETRAVTRQVTSAVDTIFSYSYADTATTKAAAQRLLTGPAIRQYDQLFALVEQQAPKEKLVVTTRVTNVGVELLTAARARVLVFANQQDSAGGTSKSSYGGAMFAVTAVLEGGTWKIDNIDTFTGSS
jgi:Mce-associated membrane protein